MTRGYGSTPRSGWMQWGVIWRAAAIVGLLLVLPVTAFTVLRDTSDTFENLLAAGKYPAAQITETRVDNGAGRSAKAYDARIRLGRNCLLHLQMGQPGLVGGGFSLVAINGEPIQVDGSPNYDQVLAKAQARGFTDCKR